MAAPWCVEFEEYVVLIVDDDVFVIVGNDHLDVTFLLLGDGLRFDAGLHLAVNELLDECGHVVVGELLALVEGEFLVLHGFLDGEGGPFVDFEVQVAGVGAEVFGVDGCEAEGSFVFLG